ncbi:hypothetical protein DYB28_001494 [Aphanomyces astaci]|uniref:Uncharacterized protein n=2 Tax=Aphanomyces astaci TaxID=112090 RepID=A0A397F947_APHAT|nr:hypothetical protein AaE_015785 [Aphanomyces astaci]RHY42174.1 hypothetical protein DYB34_002869 [Aphanomyces astaci]RHZ13755.1 hypothetical protein DYB31_014805 [Aphanomyces astaci]RLN74467.1 hypothetical protein DYB28_001494 [Aphanomyces astaci]
MVRMPPELLLRPRAHSLSRAFRSKAAPPPPLPATFPSNQSERNPSNVEATPQHNHVHWKHVSSIVGHQPSTYTDVESFDDLVYNVGGLQPDPTRSVILHINDFLSRAATHVGYAYEVMPTTTLDQSPLTEDDVACWQRLLAHPWEVDHEFDGCTNVDADTAEVLMDFAVVPPALPPPKSLWKRWLAPPKSTRLVHVTKTQMARLQCLQYIVNSCLTFGDFQFTIHDLVRVCFADVC